VLHHSLPHGSTRRPRTRRRVPLAMVCCLLISGYFAQHAISGKHGLEARSRLQERAKRISADVKKLETELQLLQRDVSLLSPEPPDADFVREIAADVLGFIPTDGLLVSSPAVAATVR
jgi:cell division protein FtsB